MTFSFFDFRVIASSASMALATFRPRSSAVDSTSGPVRLDALEKLKLIHIAFDNPSMNLSEIEKAG